MTEQAIAAQELTRVFLTSEIKTTAVDNVSFQIDRGEYVAITGPSGSGKSTLLNLLSLVERPSSGQVHLFGRSLANADEKMLAEQRARNIGVVFQAFHLIPELTALENVALRLRYAGITSERERTEQAHEAIRCVGMANRAKHYPDQLSGGQQQRIAIARAIAANPALIFADEPTGNLDSENGKQILDLFDEINIAGVTIILITHDPVAAARARRVLAMKDGKLISDSIRTQGG